MNITTDIVKFQLLFKINNTNSILGQFVRRISNFDIDFRRGKNPSKHNKKFIHLHILHVIESKCQSKATITGLWSSEQVIYFSFYWKLYESKFSQLKRQFINTCNLFGKQCMKKNLPPDYRNQCFSLSIWNDFVQWFFF